MKQIEYMPHPIDTSEIQIEGIEDIVETLAENVHEVWAQSRLEEGWQYGLERDDIRKIHPNLVPYSQLSEQDKDYDRHTALSTIKLMIKLGYNITKSTLKL